MPSKTLEWSLSATNFVAVDTELSVYMNSIRVVDQGAVSCTHCHCRCPWRCCLECCCLECCCRCRHRCRCLCLSCAKTASATTAAVSPVANCRRRRHRPAEQARHDCDARLALASARLHEGMNDAAAAAAAYKSALTLAPSNVEATASLAANHFYADQPEVEF